jgi:hypothetical protein
VVTVRRVTTAGADAVWAVLADGWRLPAWPGGSWRRTGAPRSVGSTFGCGSSTQHPGACWRIIEDVVSGPARLVPVRVRAVVIGARNVETLRRLALLAEAGTP